MLIDKGGGGRYTLPTSHLITMAQQNDGNDENHPDHHHHQHWRHMNSIETSSFGSLDEIRSFTESPPIPSPHLIDHPDLHQQHHHMHHPPHYTQQQQLEENHQNLHHNNNHASNQQQQQSHPHSIEFPTSPTITLPTMAQQQQQQQFQHRPLVNAVHMEMQENARLPTFNLTVDRSNSIHTMSGSGTDGNTGSGNMGGNNSNSNHQNPTKATHYYNPTALSPQTRKEIDDLIRLEEFDKSFSEYFLKSDQRNSLTLTYEAAGALLDELLADPNVFDNVTTTTTTPNSGTTSRSNSQRNVMATTTTTTNTSHNNNKSNKDENSGFDDPQDDQKMLSTTTTTTNDTNDHRHPSLLLDDDHDDDVDEELLNMMVVEPTPLDQIKARSAQWNLQQQQQRYHYPVMPRHSPLPIPTGISMTVSTPNQNTNSTSQSQEQQQQQQQQLQQQQTDVPSVAGLAISPLSSALATAAAIAAATAKAASTPSPIKTIGNSSDATVTNNVNMSNNSAFTQSNQHSSFHRVAAGAANTTLPGQPDNNSKEQGQERLSSPGSSSTAKLPLSSMPFLPVLAPNPAPLQNRRASYPLLPSLTPAASTINVTTTQAMATAAKMKSQFGFGGNHVVPSVPDPPPKPGTTKAPTGPTFTSALTNHAATVAAAPVAMMTPTSTRRVSNISNANAATNMFAAKKQPPHKPSSDNGTRDSGSPSSPTHTVEAYERKKQRAKDARVRLNESIERLSIAISMAGSQSKQRAGQLKDLPPSSALSTNAKTASLIRVMEDASNTAEMAKKWDRPSFVGVAASLIQGLNAECEALMELVLDESNRPPLAANQEQAKEPMDDAMSPTTNGKETTNAINVDSPSHHEVKRTKSIALSPERAGTQELQIKRQRVGSIQHLALPDVGEDVTKTLLDDVSIVQRLAFYCDPVALLRCQLVSSFWKKTGVFSNDVVWMALSLTRFGRHQVRQWMNTASTTVSASSVELYRRMDEANVMPHFRQDGMIRLGEGRIGSKVSAWAFLVKRSNGETTRSVKREPSDMHKHSSACLQCEYVPLPVVELRIVVQNTGFGNGPIVIKNQVVTVDASTRRRGEEYRAITWDDRLRMTVRKLDDDEWDDRRKMSARMMDPAWDNQFKMTIWNVDGRLLEDQFLNTDLSNSGSAQTAANIACSQPQAQPQVGTELCRLGLYDAQVVTVFLHTQGCSTMTKFQERSNFTKLLVCLNGTTVPLVIPFPREDGAR